MGKKVWVGIFFSFLICASSCAATIKRFFINNLPEGSYYLADKLSRQLRLRDFQNKQNPNLKNEPKTITYTTFVNLTNFNSSSKFGLILAEQIASRLTQQGFKVVELRTPISSKLNIDPKRGEFILSRHLAKLKKIISTPRVLLGTYSVVTNKVFVNAKIVNLLHDDLIEATADCVFYFSTRTLMDLKLTPGNLNHNY